MNSWRQEALLFTWQIVWPSVCRTCLSEWDFPLHCSFVAQNPAASEKLNCTFSCRKTSWTEKACRGSHTPGAVHSGNVITLHVLCQRDNAICVLSFLLSHMWLHAHWQQNSLCHGVSWGGQCRSRWCIEQGGDECCIFPLLNLPLLWYEKLLSQKAEAWGLE